MDLPARLLLMPNPYVLRFAAMERKWDIWRVTTETHSLMMDAVQHARSTQAINVVEARYLLKILALKYVAMGES